MDNFNTNDDLKVRQRAYALWEAAGCPEGREEEHWLQAEEEIRRAEGSLHAWAEVFLPGAGWVGLDPTNGILCNDNFIAAAVGLRPADITPISGSFYHRDRVPAEMQSRLELITL